MAKIYDEDGEEIMDDGIIVWELTERETNIRQDNLETHKKRVSIAKSKAFREIRECIDKAVGRLNGMDINARSELFVTVMSVISKQVNLPNYLKKYILDTVAENFTDKFTEDLLEGNKNGEKRNYVG